MVGFPDNKTEANKDNICATVQDLWPKISKTEIHQLWFCHYNIWREKTDWILETFQSNTGWKLKCGTIGLSIPYKHKKCCSNGKTVSIMKEPLLLLVWTIFPDQSKVKDMLIYKVGFISFQDLCLKQPQVMVKATQFICQIYRR